jgi:triosephosphate isomerase
MYEESQETINEKVKQARENNLGVIYCVGESKEEKE